MPWNDGLDKKTATYGIAASTAKHIRVIAGPGTGKSFAMKRRVARLLEEGIHPNEILAMTFTRVAAEDLHRELVQLGVPGCEELEGRTLHSVGLEILSRKHVLKTLGRTPRLLNHFEEQTMVCDLASAYGGKRKTTKLLKAYLAAWAEAQGDEPGFPPGSTEKVFAKSATDWLKFHNAMLIGEIVPYLLFYLKHNPAAKERSEFKHVLVDEYQDLNKAEQRIVEYFGESANLCIVGDDDQSIYSFKHAHPEGIREWDQIHQGVVDFSLLRCQRCPVRAVDLANSLISHNQNRQPRQLEKIPLKGPGDLQTLQFSSVDDETLWIAKEIKSLITSGKAAPGEIIVLVQRGVIGKKILEHLRVMQIPSTSYYEESQLDTEAAQQAFALFKLSLDSEDRGALRYLLGVGGTNMRAPAYAKLRVYCEKNAVSPWDALNSMAVGKLAIAGTGALVARFEEILEALKNLESHSDELGEFIDHWLPAANKDLSELRALATECLELVSSVKGLFDEMMSEITQPEIPPKVNDVRLMSLHKSKGLSSPYVFVAGCVQGLLPKLPDTSLPLPMQEASLEEQRRLFYVAITRVKSDLTANKKGSLYLSYSQTMDSGLARRAGIDAVKFVYGLAQLQPSIFLHEMGPSMPSPKTQKP